MSVTDASACTVRTACTVIPPRTREAECNKGSGTQEAHKARSETTMHTAHTVHSPIADILARFARRHTSLPPVPDVLAPAATAHELAPPRTQSANLPDKWQRLFDSVVASNMLIGGQTREHAEAIALAVVEDAMRAAPFAPRRDSVTGDTAVERAERYRRECGGFPPGTRRAAI